MLSQAAANPPKITISSLFRTQQDLRWLLAKAMLVCRPIYTVSLPEKLRFHQHVLVGGEQLSAMMLVLLQVYAAPEVLTGRYSSSVSACSG